MTQCWFTVYDAQPPLGHRLVITEGDGGRVFGTLINVTRIKPRQIRLESRERSRPRAYMYAESLSTHGKYPLLASGSISTTAMNPAPTTTLNSSDSESRQAQRGLSVTCGSIKQDYTENGCDQLQDVKKK